MSNNAPDYENNLAFDPDINTMPRCDIEALKSEIKHLKDLQNAQDKRVEELEQALREWVNWSRGNNYYRPFKELLEWTCENVRGCND